MITGKPSPTLTERNEALYNDWKYSPPKLGLMEELGKKYGISRQRALQIVDRERALDIQPRPDDQI